MSSTRLLFNAGALAYDLLTRQELWRRQIRRVLDHAPGLPAAPRVLDVGCGPGVSAFELAAALGPDAEVVGVDLADRMIALARAHHRRDFPHLARVRFQEADATRLPFAEGAFDLAVGHSFLYLVPDRPRVLAELYRVLAPGGRLILMEPSAHGSLASAALSAGAAWSEVLRTPSAAARFGTSMVLWRVAGRAAGRMSPELVRELFPAAGFSSIEVHPTLAGLGLHAVASKPRAPLPRAGAAC